MKKRMKSGTTGALDAATEPLGVADAIADAAHTGGPALPDPPNRPPLRVGSRARWPPRPSWRFPNDRRHGNIRIGLGGLRRRRTACGDSGSRLPRRRAHRRPRPNPGIRPRGRPRSRAGTGSLRTRPGMIGRVGPREDEGVALEPDEPLVSAAAVGGIDSTAAPIPRATARAPTRPTEFTRPMPPDRAAGAHASDDQEWIGCDDRSQSRPRTFRRSRRTPMNPCCQTLSESLLLQRQTVRAIS